MVHLLNHNFSSSSIVLYVPCFNRLHILCFFIYVQQVQDLPLLYEESLQLQHTAVQLW